MCARLLRAASRAQARAGSYRASERVFECDAARLRAQRSSGRCATGRVMLLILLATVALNVYLYVIVPKGFFPQQDTGRLTGAIQADQSISFQAMQQKLARVHRHRAERSRRSTNVVGFTGGGRRASATPAHVRRAEAARRSARLSADQVIARLRGRARRGAGRRRSSCSRCRTSASAAGRATRSTSSRCRATTSPSSTPGSRGSRERLRDAARARRRQHRPAGQGPADVARDRPRHRLAPRRHAAADRRHALRRLRPAPGLDDLHAAQPVPRGDGGRRRDTGSARDAAATSTCSTPSGAQVPLSAFAATSPTTTPLAVNHQGAVPVASTISFNLAPGVVAAASAVDARSRTRRARIGVPATHPRQLPGHARRPSRPRWRASRC